MIWFLLHRLLPVLAIVGVVLAPISASTGAGAVAAAMVATVSATTVSDAVDAGCPELSHQLSAASVAVPKASEASMTGQHHDQLDRAQSRDGPCSSGSCPPACPAMVSCSVDGFSGALAVSEPHTLLVAGANRLGFLRDMPLISLASMPPRRPPRI